MIDLAKLYLRLTCSLFILAGLSACSSGGGGGGNSGNGNASSNQARFTFDCDLQGMNGELVMEVEAVGSSGVTWGSGPNPDITGVIATGSVTYFTSGDLRSAVAYYIFTGENQFADFTDTTTNDRFRVQWDQNPQGLTMIINPFGPGPTQHPCVQTSARLI